MLAAVHAEMAALPELPPTLRQQVDRLMPRWYEDMLVRPASPIYNPAAQAAADARRAWLAPADHATIAEWMRRLALAVDFAPTDESAYLGRLHMVASALGDLPAVCWTGATLNEAARTFKAWPSVADIYGLLAPHADRLRRELAALDSIAGAPRDRPRPARARASTEPYAPVASTPVDPPRAVEPHAPLRSVAEQLAALGFRPCDKIVVRHAPAGAS
jgi:hypothetical protein